MRPFRLRSAARRPFALAVLCSASLIACDRAAVPADSTTAKPSASANDSVVIQTVKEAYITPFDSLDNIDSPAVWHGPNGEHWLIATAKTGHAAVVYDAATGKTIRRVASKGTKRGQLDRPNGIAIIDNLMLLVERDNHRVQGFSLPAFKPMGTFGDSLLTKPYGIGVVAASAGVYTVYITDNYEGPLKATPPNNELGHRVREFSVRVSADTLVTSLTRSFGDTTEAGRLRVVESILPDPTLQHLLIADETEGDSYLKVYDMSGRFTGQIVGKGDYPQQAEGIALYACADSGGYIISTDQGNTINTYNVFDRKTLKRVGAFTGPVARRTDGVALTQKAFGPFPAGAFFGSHLDGSVAAFSWSDIADALKLRKDCTQ